MKLAELNRVTNQGLEGPSTEVSIIDPVCVNCNKRFKSMQAVSIHLRLTATRHAVDFISYGNYDKKTGLKEMNRAEFNSNLLENQSHVEQTRFDVRTSK